MFLQKSNLHKLLIFCCLAAFAFSSSNPLFAQYYVNGSADAISCNCYQLTEDEVQNSTGSVWNTNKIDLTEPFDFTFQVYLGDGDGAGADGMAFVLQAIDTTVGTFGGGMGYAGLAPSIAVQIDTWDNESSTDPAEEHHDPSYDHVAIMANGEVDHNNPGNLAGPDYALISGLNIEDDQYHSFRVTWDPAAGNGTMKVYMDGALRLEHDEDIVANYLMNDPEVYWGFSGSTGYYTNRQRFCLAIIPGFISSATNNEICEGEELGFTDDSYSALGDVVSWFWRFNNGITSTEQNPDPVLFSEAGSYWVVQTIEDAAGCESTDSVEIVVNAGPEVDFDASDVCFNEPLDFTDQTVVSGGIATGWIWNFGDGETDDLQNVAHTYQSVGTYEVTLVVSSMDGCLDSASMSVSVFDTPTVETTYEANGLDFVLNAELQQGDEVEWLILDTLYSGQLPFNYSFPDSGWYDITATVTNSNGCSETNTFSVYAEGLPEFEIPNVFTPNGDNVNDRFQPSTYAMVQANLKVFNRWGRTVFQYDGGIPSADGWGWDGNLGGGGKASPGTYYYVIDLTGVNGDNFSEQGTVTLLR